jgi:uncharacterized protein
MSFLFIQEAVFAAAYDELLRAAELGDTRSVERMLDKGLDPNTADAKGHTLLMIAARHGHRDLAWSLIRRKANATKRSQHGDTALMFASLRGDREIARMLVEYGGAELNHAGWAPVHYAAFENRAELLRYLIQKGADKDAVAPNGYTALMLAARGGHVETAKALLYEDVDVNVRGPAGETALTIARGKRHSDLAELLVRAGAVD